MKPDPFSLSNLLHIFKNPELNEYFWYPIEWILGLKKISCLHQSIKQKTSASEYIKSVLENLEIKYQIQAKTCIPKTDPLLIICNHPFGALEALILFDHVAQSRTDIRIMANLFLKRIHPLSNILFGVMPFKDNEAKKLNSKVMFEVFHWLNNGNTLICFPAGDVSHLRFQPASIRDGLWEKQIARLARTTKSNVLPLHIEGKNSLWFYVMSRRFHALRYPLELLNKKGKTIDVQIGEVITPEEYKPYTSDKELITFFRKKSDELSAP
ncbi:MAG: hypothetical protein AB8D52_01975 [Gammaproteobacteria bacterium]